MAISILHIADHGVGHGRRTLAARGAGRLERGKTQPDKAPGARFVSARGLVFKPWRAGNAG